jgi:hypothetical protein
MGMAKGYPGPESLPAGYRVMAVSPAVQAADDLPSTTPATLRHPASTRRLPDKPLI